MKAFLRSAAGRIISRAAHRASLAVWNAQHRNFLIALSWHQVTAEFDPRIHHKYTWTPFADFKRCIDYLAENYHIVALPDAIAALKEHRLSGRCVALTFDDGDASIAEYVAPYLLSRNLPATFFINTAYIGRAASYWFPIFTYLSSDLSASVMPAALKAAASQLRTTKDARFYQNTRKQIERLAEIVPGLSERVVSAEWLSMLDRRLFTIGLHGHEHQRFSLMPAEWQRRDLALNMSVLSQFPGYVPIFALPFGRRHDWSDETLDIAQDLGLDVVLADGGINLGMTGPWLRVPSDNSPMPDHLRRAILTSQFPRLAALPI